VRLAKALDKPIIASESPGERRGGIPKVQYKGGPLSVPKLVAGGGEMARRHPKALIDLRTAERRWFLR